MNVTPIQGNLKGRLTSNWLGFENGEAKSVAHPAGLQGHVQKWAEDFCAYANHLMKKISTASKASFWRSIFASRRTTSTIRVAWAGVLRSDSNHFIAEANEEMRFHVANQMYLQGEGQRLVFDETWNAEAWQGMSGYRVVFQSDTARSGR